MLTRNAFSPQIWINVRQYPDSTSLGAIFALMHWYKKRLGKNKRHYWHMVGFHVHHLISCFYLASYRPTQWVLWPSIWQALRAILMIDIWTHLFQPFILRLTLRTNVTFCVFALSFHFQIFTFHQGNLFFFWLILEIA